MSDNNEFEEFEDFKEEDILNRWQIRKVKLADVIPMEENPRTISDRALAGLESSLTRFGYVEPIVWNERTGHIVGGHQRYGVLKEKGVEEISMMVVSLSIEEELAANLTLNNPKIEGTWDDSALPLMAQVEESNNSLFNALNMDTLKESLEKKPPDSEGDDVPPDAIDPGDGDGAADAEADKEGPDTECPCCKHHWNVRAEDVSVEELPL